MLLKGVSYSLLIIGLCCGGLATMLVGCFFRRRLTAVFRVGFFLNRFAAMFLMRFFSRRLATVFLLLLGCRGATMFRGQR